MTIEQFCDGWNSFFHARESCAPLVLFRLVFGLLLVINSLLLFPLISDYFGAEAIWNIPAWQKSQGRSRLCVLHLLPATTGSFRLLLMAHFVGSVCFLIGWQYRVASVVVFVTLVSIHHRNTFVLSGGDTVMRLLCFFMMFAPANLACGVDAAAAASPLVSQIHSDEY